MNKVLNEQIRVQQSFYRSLESYHENAQTQRQIAQNLLGHFLALNPPLNFRRVLEFGCGTGFLTKRLVEELNIDELYLNDLVPEYETKVEKTIKLIKKAQFIKGAIEEIALPTNLDLIASASTIQWVSDIPYLIHTLSNALSPNGWLVLSSFAKNHFTELQQMDIAPRATYLDADEWQPLLPTQLKIKHIHSNTHQMQFSTVREILIHLRNTGVNANAGKQWSRQKLVEFEQSYAQKFTKNGRVTLTYAPIYLIAQKI